jgi:hypothetical protein
MKHTIVKNTKKSSKTLSLISLQPSERGAHPLSSTKTEKELSREEALKFMCLILQALSHEAIISDVWILALLNAKERAKKEGVSKETMKKVINVVLGERSRGVSGVYERMGFF